MTNLKVIAVVEMLVSVLFLSFMLDSEFTKLVIGNGLVSLAFFVASMRSFKFAHYDMEQLTNYKGGTK